MNPASALADLAEHLRTGAPIEPTTRTFLADAIGSYLGGQTDDLDRALGLRITPGQRSIQTQAMIARRDELLRRLAADHFPGPSCNATAAAMHRAWSRYASSAWPRERDSDAIPVARIDKPEFRFWQILKLQDRVLSERTIRSILAASYPVFVAK